MKKSLFIFFSILILDQISKFIVYNFLPYGIPITVIKPFKFFCLTQLHNTGMAFSFFQEHNVFFIVFVSIFLLGIAIYICIDGKKIPTFQKYALCAVLAGGAGNLTDRIVRGAVIDFLDFGINNLRWPSFNIADSSICIAVFLLVFDLIKEAKRKSNA